MPDYRVNEAATFFNCSTKVVYEMIKSGVLKSYTIGKKGIRIRREELDRVRGCLQG